MATGSLNSYLVVFGLVLSVIGIFVAMSSVGTLADYSALPSASITLFMGAMVAICGVALLLLGFLSSTRRPRVYY